MLSATLVAVGGGLLIVAAALASFGCAPGAALHLAIPGLILLAALLAERWRYQALNCARPGAGWVATDERFVDPESGRLVTVFYKPATGERRYVAV